MVTIYSPMRTDSLVS